MRRHRVPRRLSCRLQIMSTRAHPSFLQHLLARDWLVVRPSNEPAVDLHLPVDVAAVVLDAAREVVEADFLAGKVRLRVLVFGGLLVGEVGLGRGAGFKSRAARLAITTVVVIESAKALLGIVRWNVVGSIDDGPEALVRALVHGPFLKLATQTDHRAGDSFQLVERAGLPNQIAGADMREKFVGHLDVSTSPLGVLFVIVTILGCDWFWLAGDTETLEMAVASS
jgi:hypothetical protein